MTTADPRSEPNLVVEDHGPVRWVRLDRPEKRNAMTRAMAAGLRSALEESADDGDVRVLVLTGTGAAFSSGADTKDLFASSSGGDGSGAMLTERRSTDTPVFPVDELARFPKPTIAAVNAPAFGGGATMAMATDLRVCAASATLTFGLAKLGLTPEWGSSYLLWRQVGWSRALDVLLTGRTVDADEALRLGFVDRVVPDRQLAVATQQLGEQLAAPPEGTAEAIKEVLRVGLDATYEEARRNELRTLGRRGRELK